MHTTIYHIAWCSRGDNTNNATLRNIACFLQVTSEDQEMLHDQW